jgi:adenine-specific DNA-methyltransferase
LAWDYEINYDQNFSILKQLNKSKLEIESRVIPSEIYNYLKKVAASNEEQINSLRNKIHFHDKPYLKLKKPEIVTDLGTEVIVRVEIDRYNILDFPMKNQTEEATLLIACKNNFPILIDYYAVDWDYDGIMFKSQSQVMAGFGKQRSIVRKFVERKLRKGKKYNIVFRLVDIFGNDSEARTEIILN